VVEEILRILRAGGQITTEQEQALRDRAKQEESGRFIAGIDDKTLKPYLGSADGNYRIELGGFVQFDYDAAESGERQPTGQQMVSQFLVRRARLNMTGEFFKWVGFKIEGDFTTSPSLTDGYIDLRLLGPQLTLGTGFEFKPFGNPELPLRGGQFKVPFSPEELESDLFIPFIERSLVNQLAPSRDVGFRVYGQLFDRVLGYNFGLFNGSGLNAPDTTNEKMFAGRLVLVPFRNSKNVWLKGLQLGVDGTVGDSENNQSARGQTTGRTNPRFQFFASQPTRGDRYRWGADLWWPVGPASLRFEYDQQRDQRKHVGPGGSDLADVVATGLYVSGSSSSRVRTP
jgi:phosphate-selective porin